MRPKIRASIPLRPTARCCGGAAHQNTVFSTIILTFPGNLYPFVNVGSISMVSSNSSLLSSDTESSVSHPSNDSGGEPADLKMPAAAAWVSVGELREADGL